MKSYEFQITNYELRIVKILCVLCVLCGAVFSANAQSTNQSYPTAITSNEISGRIAARDIGDARLTGYFYAFNGGQGDIFINVQTSNFNGDIDIFTAGSLKPLTKITIYADDTSSETGRVIYLRQPAKLILRVEGRSPNDDAATFRVKFAGSFEPAQAIAETSQSEIPEVKSENQTDVRVNSVGTIIEVKPKPLPPPKEVIAKKEVKPGRRKSKETAQSKKEAKEKEVADSEGKPSKADATENAAEEKKAPAVAAESEAEGEKKTAPVVVSENAAKTDKENSSEANKEKSVENATTAPKKISSENRAGTAVKSGAKTKSAKVKAPNPLETIRLIILFKDGTIIERAMSEVTRVGVIKGTLTVVSKDGSIGRYSILDVAKMTIE